MDQSTCELAKYIEFIVVFLAFLDVVSKSTEHYFVNASCKNNNSNNYYL